MTDQKGKWHETRKARLDELVSGKRFEVVEKVRLDTAVETPLGYKLKQGYRVRSTDGSAEFYAGKALIDTLVNDYGVMDKPESAKRGRPKKQPIAQAEQWAGRDMPSDASPVTQPGATYTNPNADETL